MNSANTTLLPPPAQPATRIVDEFGQECHRVHTHWQMLKYLFDENPDVDVLKAPHYEHFFAAIKSSLYDSFVQGVARLRDPSVMRGDETLTVNYIVDHIQWDAASKANLDQLRRKMKSVVDKLKPARNKFTAHNDLQTILQQPPLAVFGKTEDTQYFATLEEFVSVAQGERFLFDNHVPNDVAFFMTAFNRGRIGGDLTEF
jgi:hypothetical protein